MGSAWTFDRIRAGVSRRVIKAYRRLRKAPAKYELFNRIHTHFVSARAAQPVIFDVGAHHGESIERFKGLYGNAQVHSFEADVDNFKTLQERFSACEGVTLNNFGVGGASGSKIFHRNRKSDTSGFNAVNLNSEWARLRSRQQNIAVADFIEKSYEVKIGTLDDYIAKAGIQYIDILKIDTQGYEDEVLKGAQKALGEQRIGVIETELILSDIYDRALSFMDIEQWLAPHGYRLYAIDHGGNMHDALAFSLNLIYVCRSRMARQAAA